MTSTLWICLLAGALLVFAAGFIAGRVSRTDELADAGDTHIPLAPVFAANAIAVERQTRDLQQQRIRAGAKAAHPLRPSYDGNRKPPQPHA